MRAMFLIVTLWALMLPHSLQASAILFEDHFDGDVPSDAWTSVAPAQYVNGGWLYTQDVDGWLRDSMALVNDGDPSWSDYRVSLRAQFVSGTPFKHFNVLLRTNGFVRTSEVHTGSAYQLEFIGTPFGAPDAPSGTVSLWRTDYAIYGEHLLHSSAWAATDAPHSIDVLLAGSSIQLILDGALLFNVRDPEPLPFGGIGIHAIWEAHARFDDIVVASAREDVAEPSLLLLLLPTWLTAAAVRYSVRRSQENTADALARAWLPEAHGSPQRRCACSD